MDEFISVGDRMSESQYVNKAKSLLSIRRVAMLWVCLGFLAGCGSQYAYKHREYDDPDDELYSAMLLGSTMAELRCDAR